MGLLTPVPPGLFLAIMLGTLYGSLGHLVFGRHWLRLPLYLIAGIGGCVIVWLTHLRILAMLPAPGGLALVEASVVAWVLLSLIAAWRRA